ncbi:MAG: DISARM system helicase DrmA [Desulfomonilaceae bacterium]
MGLLSYKLSPLDLRQELIDLVEREILGPAGGPEEEIDERRVKDRYLVGCLAPKDSMTVPEEIDDSAIGGDDMSDDGKADSKPIERATFLQSSLGFTLIVEADAPKLRIGARWGQYTRQESANAINEKTGEPKLVWKRNPVEGSWDNVDVNSLNQGSYEIFRSDFGKVVIQLVSKALGDERIVSVYLVNEQESPKRNKDQAWLFQPELYVESMDGAAVFRKRPSSVSPLISGHDLSSDTEESVMRMLYRDHVEFAVGHGVSVHVELSDNDPQSAIRICSRVIPKHEVARQTPPSVHDYPKLNGLVLDMKDLAFTDSKDFDSKLSALPEAYADWITRQRERISDPKNGLIDFEPIANESLNLCETALERIRNGINLICSDEAAADSFRFANRAMWLQRVRSIIADKGRKSETISFVDADIPENRTWYPFQLGFILLNLVGVTDLNSDERSSETEAVLDLLWFPTGGGKTEAYLGLAAYTMGLRRRQGDIEGRPGNYGVAVLMRYTLRLLTIQQFQRAATLICACESIRREKTDLWGEEPFRIGLWVGGKATPNKNSQSEDWVKKRRESQKGAFHPKGEGSPAQLTHCPWCGTKIDPGRDIKVESFDKGRGRTLFLCPDPTFQCPFTSANSEGEGIPALVVDEEIYRRVPALLIATVDKFAQMPWKGETQNLFGQVSGFCERHGFRSPHISDADSHQARNGLPKAKTVKIGPLRPPDLIIQDELHLISGPLGTLVGLYETAVDSLCSWEVKGKTVRPKIIASTATIRKAANQVRFLFARKVNVFPPQGLEAGDNFFSLRREPSAEHPGRLYLGVMAPGIRLKAALIKVYSALLAAGQQLFYRYGTYADPWMTLVGYFNSIRELAGMRRLVEDDITSRLRVMDRHGLANRAIYELEELTSRRSSEAIPDILNKMEIGFEPPPPNKFNVAPTKGRKIRPIDTLLASNMLSVGVDIKRLGLMVVAGQPKATAEYIQATSRVGRRAPGLVVTVFNWTRPRDLSHYERFEHFHDTFYNHVEALSVTPFSARALDRGLSAVLVALTRLSSQEFNHNHKATVFNKDSDFVKRIESLIIARAKRVNGIGEIADQTAFLLKQRVDFWTKEIIKSKETGAPLQYHKEKPATGAPLLSSAEDGAWGLFTCLNSLRDVESPVQLILYPNLLKRDYE